jgi:polyisoprenoid-binding protein YceI
MIAKLVALALFAVAALAPHLHAQEMAFEFDPAQTQVAFSVNTTLHTVHGSFRLRSGKVRLDPATGNASGELIVDATSGESGNNSRDQRMHRGILESAKFSDIVFRPDHIEGKLPLTGSTTLQAHGTFLIHGAAHEMTLPIQVATDADRITASLNFSVPYIKWGMKNPSTFILRVSDQAQIEIHAVGHRTVGQISAVP